MIIIFNLFWYNMSASIFLDNNSDSEVFNLHFYNTNISICTHQLMKLLTNIYSKDSHLIDLGLLILTDNCCLSSLSDEPVYRICFGRTFLLLSEQDMVELMSQMWRINPMLMHWVLSEEQVCS